MKDMPTSGPINKSKTHQARETTSSRHSFSSSQKKGRLGERKKHLFEVLRHFRLRREFGKSSFTAYAAGVQEHEAVAEAGGIADLMDGEKQSAAARGVRAESGGDVARL